MPRLCRGPSASPQALALRRSVFSGRRRRTRHRGTPRCTAASPQALRGGDPPGTAGSGPPTGSAKAACGSRGISGVGAPSFPATDPRVMRPAALAERPARPGRSSVRPPQDRRIAGAAARVVAAGWPQVLEVRRGSGDGPPACRPTRAGRASPESQPGRPGPGGTRSAEGARRRLMTPAFFLPSRSVRTSGGAPVYPVIFGQPAHAVRHLAQRRRRRPLAGDLQRRHDLAVPDTNGPVDHHVCPGRAGRCRRVAGQHFPLGACTPSR